METHQPMTTVLGRIHDPVPALLLTLRFRNPSLETTLTPICSERPSSHVDVLALYSRNLLRAAKLQRKMNVLFAAANSLLTGLMATTRHEPNTSKTVLPCTPHP